MLRSKDVQFDGFLLFYWVPYWPYLILDARQNWQETINVSADPFLNSVQLFGNIWNHNPNKVIGIPDARVLSFKDHSLLQPYLRLGAKLLQINDDYDNHCS